MLQLRHWPPAKTDSSGVTGYAWNYENRLTSVTLSGSGGTVTFKYDPFRRRIQKSGPTGTTNYLYDGANVVTDLNASGAVVASYAQGAGVDEPLASNSTAGAAFFEADGLGSVTSLSGMTGITDTYTYNAFGVTTATGANPNRFRYTAREWDPETGLYYYRARYYDPIIGRFISEDPSAFDLEWPNLYLYVKNRPTGLIDPFGLSPQAFGPFVCTWCGEFGGGAAVMWEWYQRMMQLKWKRSDKWFHCMANCRATNLGSGGATAAKVISFFRTDVRSRWTEPTDWKNDRVANYCGQLGGNCDQTCAPFAPPPSSPGKPPFPGFPNH